MKVPQTLLKTMSYAAMHMSIAVTIAYLLSGSWQVALAIGLVEPAVQTVAFFFHERAWHRVEEKASTQDHHDSVIDSTSPATSAVERWLQHDHH